MNVFPVSTVELVKRFMRMTITDVRANKTTPVKTARTVSYYSFFFLFFFVCVCVCYLSQFEEKATQQQIIKDGGLVVGLKEICTL